MTFSSPKSEVRSPKSEVRSPKSDVPPRLSYDCTPKKLAFFLAIVFCVTSQTMAAKETTKKLAVIFFLLPMSKRNCNRFALFRSLALQGNIKYTEKVLHQPWNTLTLHLSLSLRDKKDYVYFVCLFRQKRRSLICLHFCDYFLSV